MKKPLAFGLCGHERFAASATGNFSGTAYPEFHTESEYIPIYK